ncbi:MAG: hypothetical protein Fur0024_2390 [Patescibacteria group bacterium]
MQKISIIITAWKEPETIKKLFESILCELENYKNKNYEIEILLACPDEETKISAEEILHKHNFENFIYVKDKQRGKPSALKLLFEKATGEIWVLTDGDTFWGEKVLENLIPKFLDENVGGVSGHPISIDEKNNMFGYWGHLLAESAHHKRKSSIQKNEFFPMSGYLMAIRKPNFTIPVEVLSDDAFISYKILENGKKISYSENAKVYIKYPKSLSDWYKQKARSLGGYLQLKNFGVGKNIKKTRTFFDELKYFWFPFFYAKNLKELSWSLALFPARLFLWAKIFWERKVLKKDFTKTWVRIESTK